MDFLVLGPVEVRDRGRVLALGGPRQRAVLAFLLLHGNEVVSADRLLEAVWGEEPPAAAPSTTLFAGPLPSACPDDSSPGFYSGFQSERK
jgi:hypothetical protein